MILKLIIIVFDLDLYLVLQLVRGLVIRAMELQSEASGLIPASDSPMSMCDDICLPLIKNQHY